MSDAWLQALANEKPILPTLLRWRAGERLLREDFPIIQELRAIIEKGRVSLEDIEKMERARNPQQTRRFTEADYLFFKETGSLVPCFF